MTLMETGMVKTTTSDELNSLWVEIWEERARKARAPFFVNDMKKKTWNKKRNY